MGDYEPQVSFPTRCIACRERLSEPIDISGYCELCRAALRVMAKAVEDASAEFDEYVRQEKEAYESAFALARRGDMEAMSVLSDLGRAYLEKAAAWRATNA